MYNSRIKKLVYFLVVILFFVVFVLLSTLPVSGQNGQNTRPALWGWNKTMLDDLPTPEVCFVTSPRWSGTEEGTLQNCIERTGPQLILCRLGSTENAIDPRGFRRIKTEGTTGIKIVAGISCPQGNLTIRTLSDAGRTGGSTSIWLDADHNDGVILADIYGWDNKCVQEEDAACTFEEQKQLRLYQNNVAVIRSCFHMNSGDDIAGVYQAQRVLVYQSCFGPVSKIRHETSGNRGEGQCMPISGGASEIAFIQVWCLSSGHRFTVLGGTEILVTQSGTGGWGGSNMEAGNRIGQNIPDGLLSVSAVIDDFWYLGNMPPISGRTTFMLRPLRTQGQLDAIKAGAAQIFVNRVRGSDQLGQPYRETWSGLDAWLNRARCERTNFAIDECPDRDGIAFSEIEVSDWLANSPPFELPPIPEVSDAYQLNIVNEQIGPRFRYTCEGELEEIGVGPLLSKMLSHARMGTTSPAGNDFPTRAEAWHTPWPDNAQTGVNCPDSDSDGLTNGMENRIARAAGLGDCNTCIALDDDWNDNGVPAWEEIFIHLTDPSAKASEPEPEPEPPLPSPDPNTTCNAFLLNAAGDTIMTLVVRKPCENIQ